jgi:hypothetical protein
MLSHGGDTFHALAHKRGSGINLGAREVDKEGMDGCKDRMDELTTTLDAHKNRLQNIQPVGRSVGGLLFVRAGGGDGQLEDGREIRCAPLILAL